MAAYVIASLIEKGGSGKTTTAIHAAEALGKLGFRVLIVELDPQMNATRWIGKGEEAHFSAYEMLQRPNIDLERAIRSTVVENVDLISSARALAMPERFLGTDETGAPRNQFEVLKLALERVPDCYQVVILDCPPSVGILNTNAIVAADRLLISLDPSQLTYDGFAALALTLSQLLKSRLLTKLPELSVLYTAWNPKWKIAKKVQALVEGAPNKPYHVFSRAIRNRVVLRDLPDTKTTAFMSLDESAQEVAEDYRVITEELAVLIGLKDGASLRLADGCLI